MRYVSGRLAIQRQWRSQLPIAALLVTVLILTLTTAASAQTTTTPSTPTFLPQTGFRIDHAPFAEYFRARGGVDTFGYPISRTVTLLGCRMQFFQRHLLQQCGDGPVQPMNLLDPGLMPVNRINGSTFPEHTPEVAQGAPSPQTANYGQAVAAHLEATVPNTFQGQPVRFREEYVAAAPAGEPVVALELWGFPTSRPAVDPNNRSFVYQRFQRGIMHFDQRTGATGGILLGDWFKSVLTGQELPQDLLMQMQGSRFLRQYCPDQPRGLCRPGELPETDLSHAFEPVPSGQQDQQVDVAPEARQVVDGALQNASNRLGVPRERLQILRVEEREWPDTSLGCPEPGRMYAQVITPGYFVVINDETLPGRTLEYHTDRQGRVVHC
ncbi:MAG TPA: hypothetical protein VGW38_24870 [Chloroflexota bacterium]|nr:hypothetical protein [Chloroflexota bacterium]